MEEGVVYAEQSRSLLPLRPLSFVGFRVMFSYQYDGIDIFYALSALSPFSALHTMVILRSSGVARSAHRQVTILLYPSHDLINTVS